MKAIADQLLDTAACSRRFLEKDSRAEVARFIRGQQNSDGGFRGRGSASDLYYSVFAAAGLKALGRRIPVFSLWNYVRSFGMGEDLDLVHLVSLIRLRTAFPTPGKTRRRFFQILEAHRADSAYDLFLKLLIGEHADEPVEVPLTAPTTSLAAAVVVNRQIDKDTEAALRARVCTPGGFGATEKLKIPDLLSTATALFALRLLEADLAPLRRPCLEYIESLWRDSGGFAGHAEDEFEDVEYTFYALLGIGCLMK
jgi:prenyltransferase beta subunit